MRSRWIGVGLAGLVAVMSLSGCSITRRHRYGSKLELEGARRLNSDAKRTALSLFVLPVPGSSTSRSVFDLDGRGQAAFIETHDSLDALRSNLTPRSATSAVVDRSGANRRLVVNLVHRPIEGANWRPADRVVWSEVIITATFQPVTCAPSTCEQVAATFVGYDKISTGYEVVELGKLSRTLDTSFTGASSAGVGLAAGDIASLDFDASAEGSVASNFSEEVQLRQRIVSQAVSIEDAGKTMRIVREGATGIDLTGAIFIDTQFAVEPSSPVEVFSIEQVKPSTPKSTPPASPEAPVSKQQGKKNAKIEKGSNKDEKTATPESATESGTPASCSPTLQLGSHLVRLAPPVKEAPPAIELEISGTSIIRSVRGGSHTIRESDDRVRFVVSNADPQKVTIKYSAVFGYPLVSGGQYVKVKPGKGEATQLIFESREDAVMLLNWLQQPGADFEKATCGFQLIDNDQVPIVPAKLEVGTQELGYQG